MKYVMVVGDGMADFPIEALGDRTPLQALTLDGFARVGAGELGRLISCPEGLPPGSDVAFLTLFGNDAKAVYNGRSPLEAAGMGVDVLPGEVAFRLNLAAITSEGYPNATMLSHNGGGIDGDEAYQLITDLMADAQFHALMDELHFRIEPTYTFRHVAVMPGNADGMEMTPPHDIVGQSIEGYLPQHAEGILPLMQRSFEVLSVHPINIERESQGLLPANTAWLWGAGSAYDLPNFEQTYGIKGSVISAVPLVKGIARLMGLHAPDVEGATGLLDTDYEAKLAAAMDALKRGDDYVLVHIEAPDEMSHDGDMESKLEAIRRVDARIVQPLLKELPQLGDFRLVLLPDHYTLLSTRTHDATPIPFAIYDSRTTEGMRAFTEDACQSIPALDAGDALMRQLFLA
ncbi:2,3-bisphosphoglycerate-independent phosphoglycerate mutase [Eubacteriales bacterium OttesenSCG-928-N13]|nr:2,3-bisphosphoglycerate-independent phosphoglycerate mutase [Eubacteriales bacterium OttesenSCG-928-N13]